MASGIIPLAGKDRLNPGEERMIQKTARDIIMAYLKEQFGRLAELREISIARSTSGRVWIGGVYCVTRWGDIEVGKVGVTENGRITGGLTVDDFVEALARIRTSAGSRRPAAPQEGFFFEVEEDFSNICPVAPSLKESDETNALDAFFADITAQNLQQRIGKLLASGSIEDLLEARRMMPRLLSNHNQRGQVLKRMGELEFRLGENGLGLDYLEAAARDFADQADASALEQLVELAGTVLQPNELRQHRINMLLEQIRRRLLPVTGLEQVPIFSGLDEQDILSVSTAARLIDVPADEILLKEGEKAVRAFVIKSGVLAIHLEISGGGSRLARCCFPGGLVGESSILEGAEATCNATVKTKTDAILWQFDGSDLRARADELPELRARIEAKRALNRLDSFFSTNEITDSLDVRVRDKLLGCISTIRHVRAGEVLETKGKHPESAYLIIDGRIEYVKNGTPPRLYEPDSFAAVNDTLHELPLEGDFIAVEPCRLVSFNSDALRELARNAPPEVVSVLERLE